MTDFYRKFFTPSFQRKGLHSLQSNCRGQIYSNDLCQRGFIVMEWWYYFLWCFNFCGWMQPWKLNFHKNFYKYGTCNISNFVRNCTFGYTHNKSTSYYTILHCTAHSRSIQIKKFGLYICSTYRVTNYFYPISLVSSENLFLQTNYLILLIVEQESHQYQLQEVGLMKFWFLWHHQSSTQIIMRRTSENCDFKNTCMYIKHCC